MGQKDVNASVSITFTGKEAEDQITKLTNKAEGLRRKLKEAQEALNPDKAKIEKLNKELKSVETTLQIVTNQSKKYEDVLKNLSTSTLKQLQQAQRQLNAEIQKLVPGTEEYIQATRHYGTITQRIRTLKNGYRQLGLQITMTTEANQSFMTRLSGAFQKYFAMTTTLVAGITGITTSFKKCANLAAQLDDTYSDVMKTTGLLRDEVADLDKELTKLDTRTSREQLLLLARDAGKLGITGKDNILGFVRAADKIQVALGEDLGEGAIRNLGKIADVLGYTKSMGIEKALLSIGSSINAVGQASTASEAYLVEFVQRLAGVGAQAGISAADLIGFASGLDQSAMKVEMAATAFQKFLMKLYEDPKQFAEYAKMEVQEFTDLLNNDANTAIVTVLQSLKDQDGFASLVPIFKDMGLDGARAVSVLASMASNLGAITDAQSLANVEFEKASSVQEEFATKNNNLQAKLEKARKEFNNAAIALGQSLNPIMLKSTNLITYLIKALASYGKEIAAATLAVVAFYVALKVKVIWMKAVAVWHGTLRARALLLAAAYNLLTGNIHRATAAWRAMSTAMKTTLLGIAAAAIAGIVVAITRYINKTKEATSVAKDMAEIEKKAIDRYGDEAAKIRTLDKIVHDNNISIEERKRALEELKKIVPGYLADLTDEGVLLNDNRVLLDKYIESLRAKAVQDVMQDEIKEMEKQRIQLELELEQAKKKRDDVLVANGGDTRLEEQKTLTMVGFDMTWDQPMTYTTAYGRAVADVTAKQKKLDDLVASQTKTFELYNKVLQQTNDAIKEVENAGGTLDSDGTVVGKPDYKEALKDLEKHQEEETNVIKKHYADGEINEAAYTEQINLIRLQHLQQKIDLAKEYGEDETTIVAAYLDEQIRQNQAAMRELENIRKEEEKKKEKAQADELEAQKRHLEQLTRLAERFKKELLSPYDSYLEEKSKLDELRAESLIDEEEYQKLLLQLKKKYAEESVNAIDSDSSLGIWEKYEAEKEALRAFFEEGEIGWEEYEKAVKELRINSAKQTMNQISSTLSQLGSLVSSMRDMEMAQAEAQYQADLTAAGDNAEERERIEQEYQEKQLEIKKKYADVDMAINIAKAIASGALAAVEAFAAAGGNPVLGAIFAAIIAATTIAEIATIIAQRNAIKNASVGSSGGGGSSAQKTGTRTVTGYSDGGYTDSASNDSKPVGIVHANEWVAPAWMVRENPVRFANLERYRKSRGYSSSSGLTGFEGGGYTGSGGNTAQDGLNTADFAKAVANAVGDAIRSNPVRSYVVRNDIKELDNQDERFKKQTSR